MLFIEMLHSKRFLFTRSMQYRLLPPGLSYRIFITAFLLILSFPIHGQHMSPSDHQVGHKLYRSIPNLMVKTNMLYDLAGFNLGTEFRLGSCYTMDISANYNPFTFNDNKKFKHIVVQPELRRWLYEPFYSHFFGLHGHAGEYNIGNVSLIRPFSAHRYRGWLAGGGFSYGYHWVLGNRWSLEATIGLGYTYLEYSKYECAKCGPKLKKDHRHYVGPTKAGISLIYVIK